MKKTRFNHKKFLTNLIAVFLVAILAVMSISSLTGTLVSDAMEVQQFTEYTVMGGDTLWSIAKIIRQPSQDVRAVIHQITELNQLDSTTIQPGQLLKLPYEEVADAIQSNH